MLWIVGLLPKICLFLKLTTSKSTKKLFYILRHPGASTILSAFFIFEIKILT